MILNRKPTRNSNQQAFTLIEVLFATVAFAIVLAAINTVFYGALRMRERSDVRFKTIRPQFQALEIIKLSFYDGEIWQETWDSEIQDPVLPKAVQIYLEFAPTNQSRQLPPSLTQMVAILAEPRLAESEEEEGGEPDEERAEEEGGNNTANQGGGGQAGGQGNAGDGGGDGQAQPGGGRN